MEHCFHLMCSSDNIHINFSQFTWRSKVLLLCSMEKQQHDIKWSQINTVYISSGPYFMYTILHASSYLCFIQRGWDTSGTSKLEILVSCKEVVVALFHQGIGVGGTLVSSKGMGIPLFHLRGDRVYSLYQSATGTPVSSPGVRGTLIYIYYSSNYSS